MTTFGYWKAKLAGKKSAITGIDQSTAHPCECENITILNKVRILLTREKEKKLESVDNEKDLLLPHVIGVGGN